MWYRSKKTNKIISSSSAVAIVTCLGDGYFDEMIEKGELEMIDDPTVIDILKSGSPIAVAAERYRQIHSVTIAEARKMVSIIRRDINKVNGVG